ALASPGVAYACSQPSRSPITTAFLPFASRSPIAGVNSVQPPVHLGQPDSGWPLAPSHACSAPESAPRMMSGLPSPVTSASAGALRNASPCSGCVYCARLAPLSGFQASTAERTRIPLPGVSTTPVTTSFVAELAWTAVSAPAPSLPIDAVVVKCTSEDDGLTGPSAGIEPGLSLVALPVRRSIV